MLIFYNMKIIKDESINILVFILADIINLKIYLMNLKLF